jgi:hypothetical protein
MNSCVEELMPNPFSSIGIKQQSAFALRVLWLVYSGKATQFM